MGGWVWCWQGWDFGVARWFLVFGYGFEADMTGLFSSKDLSYVKYEVVSRNIMRIVRDINSSALKNLCTR